MRVGWIGWRGMVGSVLMERMSTENDFEGLDCAFFSTSNAGGTGPDVGHGPSTLLDAHDLRALAACEVLLTCQGGDYTRSVFPKLRNAGWTGIWIDAASALRMADDVMLALDPINGDALRDGLARGVTTFCGANCTVSLMLMGLQGLFAGGHVEWMTSMTYQSASGAGARNLAELVAQMKTIGDGPAGDLLDSRRPSALAIDAAVSDTLRTKAFPTQHFGAPLAASAIPWIDRLVDHGQTREEWKAQAEANKLLGREQSPIPMDGICVRIGAMRCHAQAVTMHLDRAIPLADIEAIIGEAHPWVEVVPNDKASTLERLTPAAVSGSLQVPVGRLRPLTLGPRFLTAFTVGDQLLWGAAEPLRRMLRIVREHRA